MACDQQEICHHPTSWKESVAVMEEKPTVKKKKGSGPFGLKIGDCVSVGNEVFDGKDPESYSKDNPGRSNGVVVQIWKRKNIAQVEWEDESKNLLRVDDLQLEKSKVDVMFIVTAIMMDVIKKPPDPNDKTL